MAPLRRNSALLLAAGTAVLVAAAQDAPERPALWRLAEELAAEGGLEAELRAVVDHFAEARAGPVPSGTLERVRAALARPWSVPGAAAELRDALQGALAGKNAALDAAAAVAAAWLELPAVPADDADLRALEDAFARVADPAVEGADLLQALSDLMGRAHAALAAALGPGERDALFGGFLPFCDAWRAMHAPGARPTDAQAAALQSASKLCGQEPVDRARVLAVARVLARLGREDVLGALARRLARTPKQRVELPGFDGDLRASAGDAPSNRVVLGGRGASVHAGAAALVLDLGGDDRWERAAVVDAPDALAAVAIDLAGDDAYESRAPGPAYACGGVAILVDRAGKDVYRSARAGQAAAFLGFALLADLAGDDAYSMEDFGQAYALGGAALCFDASGDDVYDAWAYAQGAGNGPGFAALVDGGGDDRYRADGEWPDIYGDSGPDVHHGAAQGFSSGLRPSIAGGVAALLDHGRGADVYESGSFSQGGAYFFALALLYDDGGADQSRGARYSQGFGVHQAAAVKWDAGGDDRYACRSVASLGIGWDEGVGVFLDDAGDDVYEGGGLACGAAAQTAVALFVDGGGDDRYLTLGETDSQGGCGASDYHGKPSLALLLDLGGGKDAYSRPGRADGGAAGAPGCALFRDAKEKTVEQILRRR